MMLSASVRGTASLFRRTTLLNVIGTKKMTSKRRHREIVQDEEMRVFSGIQPTGIPHLGNYLGAIKLWRKLQEDYHDVMYSVVDLHAITVRQDPKEFRENIYKMVACLLACGIDPEKSVLFLQSQVQQHTELCWILSCITTSARLQHLPQWQEKSNIKSPNVGLFTYPILQAADILLYKSTLIPIGEDQRQHLDLCEDLAISFNNKFGKVFRVPKMLLGNTARIKSLKFPENKMSKSDKSSKGRIDLTDSNDVIASKIKTAVTDFTSQISYDKENRPGVTNLIDIHAACTGETPDDICETYASLSTAEYKKLLADIVITEIQPIRERIVWLLSDKSHLQSVLSQGQEVASVIAEDTMTDVRKLVGFT
ncbi:tryptophan--tRNA ligase, mitochondrial-like [Ostrea edulis]|uniref:tryptophan--tRNA ligase, mitochondrial-like n=1 Tax=Ostrea edulis TaxID=37623 RepID=UPI0024AF6C28|nr:tryptophan--tRNA ligase, mitochondrial-like [Ostrea edulis]